MITKSISRFDGVFIRELGVTDISYLNELKIVGAPFNLMGKKVTLTFSQERLQTVNATITLRRCERVPVFIFATRVGCLRTPCPAQQYNVCPAENAMIVPLLQYAWEK